MGLEPASVRPSVRPCVHTFKHEYQIRTPVSMATDSSHRVIMGKGRHHVFSAVFDRILFILADNYDIHKSLHEFEIRPDPTTDNKVSCP